MNGEWDLRSNHSHLIPPVIGNLALSRAIGDFEFKQNFSLPPEQQIVTSNPDVLVHDITEDDEFLVMACDGTMVHSISTCPGTHLWFKVFGTVCHLRKL